MNTSTNTGGDMIETIPFPTKYEEMKKLQNAVNLIGRSGVTPTVRTFDNGMKLAKFSLATNEIVNEINGKKTITQWHSVIAWGGKAELIHKYVKKGQLLAIDGKLVNRVYKDHTGTSRRVTEIQLDEIYIISPKKASA